MHNSVTVDNFLPYVCPVFFGGVFYVVVQSDDKATAPIPISAATRRPSKRNKWATRDEQMDRQWRTDEPPKTSRWTANDVRVDHQSRMSGPPETNRRATKDARTDDQRRRNGPPKTNGWTPEANEWTTKDRGTTQDDWRTTKDKWMDCQWRTDEPPKTNE